jgi:hypothetical protein
MKKLLEYLEGTKRGKDARKLERLSMQDEFLKEAIDGYDEIKGNHIKNIKTLESKILEDIVVKKNKFPILAVASSIIILISVGIIYILISHQKKEERSIAFEKSGKKVNHNILSYSIINDSNYNKEKESFNSAQEKLKKSTLHVTTLSNNLIEKKVMSKDFFRKKQSKSVEEDADMLENKLIARQDFFKPINSENYTEPILYLKSINIESDLENVKNNDGSIVQEDSLPLIDSLNAKLLSYTINLKKIEEVKRDTTLLVCENKNNNIRVDSVFNIKVQLKSQPIIGRDKFNEYIYENLLVNNENCDSIEVKIVVGFSVGKEGRPKNIHILQSNCNKLTDKIIELIKEGCAWTEGEGIFKFGI